MDEKNVLDEVRKAVTEEATTFEMDIKPLTGMHALLQKMRILPKKKRYLIGPSTLGTMTRISTLVMAVEISDIGRENFLQANFMIAKDHGEKLAEIIALAITNSKKYPEKKLIMELFYNLTPTDLLNIVSIVLHSLDVKSFIATIALIKSLNVLEKSEKKTEPKEVSL
jgi:hypothetical protein